MITMKHRTSVLISNNRIKRKSNNATRFILNKTNTKPVESIYFLALLARLRSSSLQIVEYCEFISSGIKAD